MNQNIEVLRNSLKGKDIFIIGSGKSIDFIPDSFWDARVCIGVNLAYQRVKCEYTLCHHYCVVQPMIDSGLTKVVTSEAETCVWSSNLKGWTQPVLHDNFGASYYGGERLEGDYFWYHHNNQGYTRIDLDKFNHEGYLTAGGTIVTTAIHFAYFLGAKNIILAGVDGGFIDKMINYDGYPIPTNNDHMKNVQGQVDKISNHIRALGVPVTSINPFTNFCMEGHTFKI